MTGFNALEARAVSALASLYLVRMLGLFMALPVLSLYAGDYRGSTPFLIGVAIGVYGLSQAALQLPLGLLSDRIGRRPVIIGGLLMLLIGSVIAAYADSVYGLIVGRLLQGSGAIASAMMALLADLTRESNRSKAMAAVGASIGISFMISLVIGPWVSGVMGLSGLFLFTAALAVVGLLIAFLLVPRPLTSAANTQRGPVLDQVGSVLRDQRLLRLDIGVFCLHLIITALFVVIPLVLSEQLGIEQDRHGLVYLGLLGLSFVAMIPMLILAERQRRVKQMFLVAVGLMVLTLAGLGFVTVQPLAFLGMLFVFFVGFNYLEAGLPSLVSRAARASHRGTASGIYSTCQFLGAFCGGAGGGFIFQHAGLSTVFLACAAIAFVWWLVALGMPGPEYLRTLHLRFDDNVVVADLSSKLQAISGVREVLILAGATEATLQVVEHQFDEASLAPLPVQLG